MCRWEPCDSSSSSTRALWVRAATWARCSRPNTAQTDQSESQQTSPGVWASLPPGVLMPAAPHGLAGTPRNASGKARITSPRVRLRVPRGALVPTALARSAWLHARSGNSGRAWDPAGGPKKGRTAAVETQMPSPGVWWVRPQDAFVSPVRCAAASVVLVLISPWPRNR